MIQDKDNRERNIEESAEQRGKVEDSRDDTHAAGEGQQSAEVSSLQEVSHPHPSAVLGLLQKQYPEPEGRRPDAPPRQTDSYS